jgi:hypothetical protein
MRATKTVAASVSATPGSGRVPGVIDTLAHISAHADPVSLRFQSGGPVRPQQCRLKSQQTHVAQDGVELEIRECGLAAESLKLDQPTDGDPAGRKRLREAHQANGCVGSRSANPVDLAGEPVLELVGSDRRVRVATDRDLHISIVDATRPTTNGYKHAFAP